MNFKITDHHKLNTAELQYGFIEFMLDEYRDQVLREDGGDNLNSLLIEPEQAVIEAYDFEDFDFLVHQFLKQSNI
jgi:hypothetical protein